MLDNGEWKRPFTTSTAICNTNHNQPPLSRPKPDTLSPKGRAENPGAQSYHSRKRALGLPHPCTSRLFSSPGLPHCLSAMPLMGRKREQSGSDQSQLFCQLTLVPFWSGDQGKADRPGDVAGGTVRLLISTWYLSQALRLLPALSVTKLLQIMSLNDLCVCV